MKKNYLDFEKNLGYSFKNKELLKNSLIHRSFGNEHRRYKKISNERLELLGDAVLDLVVTEYLYKSYADSTEGDLAKVKSMVVSEPVLAGISKKLEVGKYLLLSRGEELTGGRERSSILGDAFEAILGAIYMDSNFETAKKFKKRPTVIIAKTVKGKGVSFMENTCAWHGKAPSAEDMKRIKWKNNED